MLSGGKKFGPPPKKEPNPQGITVSIKKKRYRFSYGIIDGEGSFPFKREDGSKIKIIAIPSVEMTDKDVNK